jgi:hypothetical protein
MGRGFGTEKIEDQIAEIFPEAKIARMDLDTTRTRNAYERLIADFSEGRTNLLIGTQMVSKGLDFDKVSVVGILNADSMLNYPDFRAYEHAFMMMAQVSGRAGRKGKRGLVILQTKNPTLPVIGQVVHNDYAGVYQGILEERRTFHYPPFFHLINVYVKHKYDKVCEQASHELSKTLRSWFGERVLGPDKPAYLALGVGYSPVDAVRVNVGFHWFDDKHATSYNNRQEKLKRGTLEYNAGVEVDVNKKITLSTGWQNTNYGLSDEYMDDKSFVVSSNSVAVGGVYHINKKMDLNVAYFHTFYQHKKTSENVELIGKTYSSDYTRNNNVFAVGLDINF